MIFSRKLKNVINNYTQTEILVREATCCQESWGPSNSLMSRIAELSNEETKMMEIMPIIWRRLKDTGRKWLHVYKSLVLMEFLILRGNPSITDHCRQHIHFVKSLEGFQVRQSNKHSDDVQSRIRRRVGEILRLLKDESHLRESRRIAIATDVKFSRDVVSQGSNLPMKYGNGSLSQAGSMTSFDSIQHGNHHRSQTTNTSTGVLPKSRSMNLGRSAFAANSHLSNGSIAGPGASSQLIGPHDMILAAPANSIEEDIQLEIALAESKLEADQQQKKRYCHSDNRSTANTANGQKSSLASHYENAEDQSLASHQQPQVKCDPWPSNDMAGDSDWVAFSDSNAGALLTPAEANKPVPFNHSDPWSPPPSNNNLVSNQTQVSSAVTSHFLGQHSYLIDFDHLISSPQQQYQSSSSQINDRFINGGVECNSGEVSRVSQSNFNPFLVPSTDNHSTHYQKYSSHNPFINHQQLFPAESLFQINSSNESQPHTINNASNTTNQIYPSSVPHRNTYNPFLDN